ncbi:siderophore-interacting protein [Acidipila sp. EB88]|nr:siderophore-interacting protein [Acidipila sp. EB88]
MLRILFESSDLAGFHSPSPDDHIKIFLPGQGEAAPAMRDFTPRAWNIEAGSFTLDFALHPKGPAVEWAHNARIGDTLEIGGPRGSNVAPSDFDWYLLVGDATALPSIARRMESLPGNTPVHVVALVAGPEEQPYLAPSPSQHVTWLHQAGSLAAGSSVADSTAGQLPRLLEAINHAKPPTGDGFIWVGAENTLARGIYRHVVDTLAHPPEWTKAAAYWSQGEADGGGSIS